MNTAIMKNWHISNTSDGFTAPELVKHTLVGEIFNDSAERFSDGDRIRTSAIQNIRILADHKIIETANTQYVIYPENIDHEYERQYPGAYERLKMTGGLTHEANSNTNC